MNDVNKVEYRYILTDLLTDTVLAELPFTGVSYSIGLSSAGDFSGSLNLPIPDKNTDLYNVTMPGRTALYVLRNNKCVWGGIVWSREYSIIERTLSVSALEFTSYFHHRKVWKTSATTFGGVLVVPNDTSEIVEIRLDIGTPFEVNVGDPVQVIFAEPYVNLTSFFEILPNSNSDVIYIEPKKAFTEIKSKKVTEIKKSQATVRLKTKGSHNLTTGDVVSIGGTGIERLDGTRTVVGIPSSDVFTVKVGTSDTTQGLKKKDGSYKSVNSGAFASKNGSIPPGSYIVSVDIRPTTYAFIKGLIESTMSDFTSSRFPNEEIEAGVKEAFDIQSYSCAGGVARITTVESHGLSVSQNITIKNLLPSLNGSYYVLDVIDDNTFTYRANSNQVPYTEIEFKQIRITKKRTKGQQTTFTLQEEHGIFKGDSVSVRGLPTYKQTKVKDPWNYNAEDVKVVTVPSPTTLVVDTYVTYNDPQDVVYDFSKNDPYLVCNPSVVIGSYGPYPNNADIGIRFDDRDSLLFGLEYENSLIRGFEVKSVAEVLDNYAAGSGGSSGFDYRIECNYDPVQNKFIKIFRLVPFYPGGRAISGDAETLLEELGADSVVFEYPGNISEMSFSESAEDAGTRAFMVGNQEGLADGASQPYSAGVLENYLLSGWPLLDIAESDSSTSDETILAGIAESYVQESAPPMGEITVSINGSISPVLGTYSVGDWCTIIVRDEFFQMKLKNDAELRDDVLVRKITKLSVSVGDASPIPETVSLTMLSLDDKNQYRVANEEV